MDEKMEPDADVQLWCEEYEKNRTEEVNGTLGIHPSPTIWADELTYTACLKVSAYIVIFTGGLLGNVSVILSVWMNKSMRNTTNYYVANLAVSDALICIFCMVPNAMYIMTQDDAFLLGKFMCNFTPFSQLACLASSSLTLTAISCDRSVAILHPFRSRVTKQRPSFVIAFIWIVSIAVAVPNFITKKYVVYKFENFEIPRCNDHWSTAYHYDPSSDWICHPYHPLLMVYVIVASAVIFILPMLIMVTAYSLILCSLWRTKVPGEQIATNVDAHTRAKRKVNKMVFVVLVVFIICWTPEEFVYIYFTALDSRDHARYPDWFEEIFWFADFLAFANSFLNPFIYGGFNRTFLKGFSTIQRCGFIKKTKRGTDRSKAKFSGTGVLTKDTSEKLDQRPHKSVEMKLL